MVLDSVSVMGTGCRVILRMVLALIGLALLFKVRPHKEKVRNFDMRTPTSCKV